jgi:glycosyltransferase involved in cell wall biosynthesis
MIQNNPLVSVIIPTYNYGKFIREAIDSVLNSGFTQSQVEIIVIDDGSIDDTSEIVKAYKDRVNYIAQKNSGKAWATKVGIDCAKGEYVFNLDADDLFLPNKLQNVVDIFETDRDIIHVAHPAIYWNVDDDTRVTEPIPDVVMGRKIWGKELLSYFYKRRILFGGGSTFAARAEALKRCIIPKEVDMYIDEYLVLNILNQEGDSFFIEQPLSIWRIHGKNFSNESSSWASSEAKAQRSMRSMEAVLANVMAGDFEEYIKKLYLLKFKVLDLALKEQKEKKSLGDILNMWLYILSNFPSFGKDSLSIIKNYTILNRTLPTPILRKLRQAKGTLIQ